MISTDRRITDEDCRQAFAAMYQARREGYAAGRRDATAGKKCTVPQDGPASTAGAYADAYLLGYAENWR